MDPTSFLGSFFKNRERKVESVSGWVNKIVRFSQLSVANKKKIKILNQSIHCPVSDENYWRNNLVLLKLLHWTPLKGINLGQTINDPNNLMILIGDDIVIWDLQIWINLIPLTYFYKSVIPLSSVHCISFFVF